MINFHFILHTFLIISDSSLGYSIDNAHFDLIFFIYLMNLFYYNHNNSWAIDSSLNSKLILSKILYITFACVCTALYARQNLWVIYLNRSNYLFISNLQLLFRLILNDFCTPKTFEILSSSQFHSPSPNNPESSETHSIRYL